MAVETKTRIAQSVTGFLQHVFKMNPVAGVRCFRGEANVLWDLKPSIMRDFRPNAEQNILLEMMAEASTDFVPDRMMFSKLVRAQHYGLPTRLLDVSLNPLVALYFACADEPHSSEDGKVVILDFKKRNIKYPESDAISLICNLSRLSDDERDELRQAVISDRVKDVALRELNSAKRLLQFVRMEKPYFDDQAESVDFRKYYFVYPEKTNRRVTAQSGAFVAAGLLSYRSVDKTASFEYSEIKIPKQSKLEILRQLDIVNINARSMFPEIEYTSRYIKKKWETKPTSNIEDLFGDLII